jgi:hypothetical protein
MNVAQANDLQCTGFPPELRGLLKTAAVSVVATYDLFAPPEDVAPEDHISTEVVRLNTNYLFARQDADAVRIFSFQEYLLTTDMNLAYRDP